MKRNYILAALVAVAAAGGWWYWRTHADHSGATGTAPTAKSAGQSKGGRGAGTVAVETAPARQGDFPVIVRTLGWIESPATVTVRSRVDSQVLEQHVKDGQTVAAGDLLFVLDARNLQVQLQSNRAALARDEALHARAAADLRRKQDLLPRGATTQQQVDQALADERAAAAAVAADRAAIAATELSLSYTRVTAPIAGRIGAVQVTPGNLVGGGAGASGTTGSLVTITQMAPIQASFSLAERYLDQVRQGLERGAPAQVRLYTSGTTEPVDTGEISFIDSSVDMQSATITAKARFANADRRLWPGQYVDVEVVLETLRGVTMVPTVAVQTGLKGRYVYVVKPDQTIETRWVLVAASDAANSVVGAGLQAGEKVVIEGQQSLQDGARVREPSASSEGRQRTSSAHVPTTGSVTSEGSRAQ